MPVPEQRLRPVERCVLRLVGAGVDDEEIARRFKRSPAWVAQVRRLADLERPAAEPATTAGVRSDSLRSHSLRPLERRLLRWREHGVAHEELGVRFRRSPEFLERVEEYAHFKLAAG
jgi:DNA-binding CsgD family transcriptional regulator